ncbi:MAG: hypothetical protein M5U14_09625 [Acidimicrobiia bacterium]|nr:hypothetical protein [Acidimicrobiia bacterium]
MQQVFGDSGQAVELFAQDAAVNLGLSSRAALEAAGTFGNLFVALELPQGEAAALSEDVLQLAADLGSFNDVDPTEVLERLRSGLVGEIEPLRRLGVNFNAAQVEAKAFELGLTDASGAVSEAAKVQARWALILEQTVPAQGDFARTSDSLANAQRTLAGLFGDVQERLGDELLPVMKSFVTITADSLLPILETVGDPSRRSRRRCSTVSPPASSVSPTRSSRSARRWGSWRRRSVGWWWRSRRCSPR